jgi:hypothetical protein
LPFQPARRALDRLVASMNPEEHLANSWMWKHPRVRFSEGLRFGHYVALEVDLARAVTAVPGLPSR